VKFRDLNYLCMQLNNRKKMIFVFFVVCACRTSSLDVLPFHNRKLKAHPIIGTASTMRTNSRTKTYVVTMNNAAFVEINALRQEL
jgi:hypothetical protein